MKNIIIREDTIELIRHAIKFYSQSRDISQKINHNFLKAINLKNPTKCDLEKLSVFVKVFGDDLSEYKDYAQSSISEKALSINALFYEEEVDLIPIYGEAIAVMKDVPFYAPNKSFQILYNFIQVNRTKHGLDIENHNFGYHFHLGEVKKDVLNRYDVILTFDPKEDSKVQVAKHSDSKPYLYVETHGRNKYKHIDYSTIQENRRRPIYNECLVQMERKGIKSFMRPSKDSSVFYPYS